MPVPGRVPGPAAARPPAAVLIAADGSPGAAAARLGPFPASWPAPRDGRVARGGSRRVLTDRKDQAMAQTLPICAGQPPDPARTAAGHVAALAGAQAAAVQAAASLTLTALLWPLIPAARAVAGLAGALGQRLPLRPPPEQPVAGVMPGSGGEGRAATARPTLGASDAPRLAAAACPSGHPASGPGSSSTQRTGAGTLSPGPAGRVRRGRPARPGLPPQGNG